MFIELFIGVLIASIEDGGSWQLNILHYWGYGGWRRYA